MVTLTYNLSISEANTGGSRVQFLPQPDNEFWPSLDNTKPCFKTKKSMWEEVRRVERLLSIFESWQLSFGLRLIVMICVFTY